MLSKALQHFSVPFEFINPADELNMSREGFLNDMRKAESVLPERQNYAARIIKFQNTAWCRHISAVFSNQTARKNPELGHALLLER